MRGAPAVAPSGSVPVPNGFSLIEVLVALTVFAVAALALLRLTAVGLQGSGDLDRRLLREVVAGNLAAQWSTDPVLAGDGEGELVNAGRRFVWQRKVVRDHGVAVARIVVRLADAPGEAALVRAARLAGP